MSHYKPLLGATLLALWSLISVAKDLPGAAQTSYGVSPSGAFNAQIPIVVPQGRNGVQPNLALAFTSGGGNGSVGVGWGVSGLGAITRCGRTIATDGVRGGVLHNANDRFCLNGKRLIKVAGSGSYGAANSEYRTEIDDIAKIIGYGSLTNLNGGTAPTYFKVWRKDGMIMYYGNVVNARYTVPNSTSTHAWKLYKTEDRNGNHYTVSYTNTYRLPSSISYAGGHTVAFQYQTRPDVRSRYLQGKKITFNQRLSKISVKRGSTVLRSYSLAYQAVTAPEKSKLTSVTECGVSESACLPAIAIAWQATSAGLTNGQVDGYQAADYAPPETSFYFDSSSDNLNREIRKGQWADVNGDGHVDQIIAYRGPTGGDVFKTYLQTVNANGQVSWVENADFRLPHVLMDYSRSITDASYNNFKTVNQGQLADVNGDGLVDIVYAVKYQWYNQSPGGGNQTKTIQETWINKGNNSNPNDRKGWALNTAYKLPDLMASYLDNSGVFTHTNGSACAAGCQFAGYVETRRGRLVDINGDGLLDWVGAYHRWNHGNFIATWTNTGNGWLRNETFDLPDVFAEFRGLHSLRHGELVDVNGDGRLDWVQSYHSNTPPSQGGGAHTATWLNTETGFTPAASHFNLPNMLYENLGAWQYPRNRGSFIDVNGDGRRDFVLDSEGGPGGPGSPRHHYGSDRETWLNTGRGWAYAAGYNTPFEHKDHRYIGHTGQAGNQSGANWPLNINGYYLDLNNDGLIDYTQNYKDVSGTVQQRSWINTGTGWQEDASYNLNRRFFDYSGRDSSKVRYGDWLDMNSDGRPDWVASRAGETRQTHLSNTARSDQLQAITTTAGAQITPTFKPLTDNTTLYQKGTGTPQANSRHITGPIYVTAELAVSNAIGSNNVTQYRYRGAQAHREGRGFLGFKTVTTINNASGLTQTSEYRQDYPYIGLTSTSTLKETAVTNPATWLSQTTNSYAVKSLNGNKTKYPYLSNRSSITRELNANGAAQFSWAASSQTVDNYGNVLTSTADNGLNSSNKLLTNTVSNSYKPINTATWLVGRLATSSTTQTDPNNAGSAKTRTTEYRYHSSQGWLIKDIVREPNASDLSLKLTTSYGYDAYGNVTQETITSPDTTDPNRVRSNAISYDSDHRLPTTLSNALGHTSTITYDTACDQPATVTDINQLATSYSYDGLCRQATVTDALGITAETDYNFSPTCTACEYSVTSSRKRAGTAIESPVTVFYNRFSQALLSRTTGMLPSQTIEQRTGYDALGRVITQSQPRFTSEAEQLTTTQYDLLNRPTLTSLPYAGRGANGKAIIEYEYSVVNGRQQRVTRDPLNYATTVFANALGQIDEIQDAKTGLLKYQYDAQGNLTQTEAMNNPATRITVGYDLLGRRTSLDDPDLGLSNYTYDAFSQLRSQTDAKGNLLSMHYDPLGRLSVERHFAIVLFPTLLIIQFV